MRSLASPRFDCPWTDTGLCPEDELGVWGDKTFKQSPSYPCWNCSGVGCFWCNGTGRISRCKVCQGLDALIENMYRIGDKKDDVSCIPKYMKSVITKLPSVKEDNLDKLHEQYLLGDDRP